MLELTCPNKVERELCLPIKVVALLREASPNRSAKLGAQFPYHSPEPKTRK
ncbi:TPA: hypothetical protein ACN32O_003641 [Vibrio parahaemolyticus]